MRFRSWSTLVALSLACVGATHAHETGEGKGQLGSVSFANSCDTAVQADLQRAMAMLHSFWYSAGEAAFRDVLARDPGCGIANFGIAAILMSNPLAGQGASPKGAETAQAAIEQGRRSGAKTQRERDYIEAVAAYYEDFANRPERARQMSRATAFEALASRYPDDDEAQIFAAVYVAATQSQADQTYASYLKAAGMLERLFAKYPDHPGVAHYLIHSYDAPPIASKGLAAARRYSEIAPDSPHALHMPSHIFTRVGAWQESIATNRRSADVAKKAGDGDEAFHAADYMVYALLQMGRDDQARGVLEEFAKVTSTTPTRFIAPYAAAAMPARIALERRDWAAAAALPSPAADSRFAFCDAITVFTRALGAARSGNLPAAEQESQRLASLHRTLLDAKNSYWATEVEVQNLAAAAWIAHGRGQTDEALRLMKAAADLEDRNEKHIVTPGRVLPARELLGEMLLEAKRPVEALAEFERSQEREPNRFRGFLGAAQAADAAGDRTKAQRYYTMLVELAREAEGSRPELASAKTFLASR